MNKEHNCKEKEMAVKERYPYLIIDITYQDQWELELYEDFRNNVYINYCPFCGAELKNE